MFENQSFAKLVAARRPTGEVVGVKNLLATVRGLEGASVNSLVLFENGDRGLVRAVNDTRVEVLAFSADGARLGSLVVLESDTMRIGVGKQVVGRVVNALGQPLDGKGEIVAHDQTEVFATAPGIIERTRLSDQLSTGVAIVDSLFPVVLGQRIAILGDNKSGKSTFLRQVTRQQTAQGQIVIYVLIAKRQVEVDTLIAELEESGAMKRSIVVIASSFDSLSHSYLAPYVACAIGEYLWKEGNNVVMIYDDLSTHAKAYRELSLLAEVSPGRDSYPGDMFFAHSSLLERAGKLKNGGGTLSALPVVLTPNDDITSYLPTSIMSITDGQLIFDLESFHKGIRPALNVGLSVSRVGGSVQSKYWKALTGQLFKQLAAYNQSSEFARFGSELSTEARASLALGRQLYAAYRQLPRELYSLPAQYLLLATILAGAGRVSLNMAQLKQEAAKRVDALTPDTDPSPLIQELLQAVSFQVAE